MSNESVDFYLSFELFEKQDKIKQDGGKKKVKKVKKKVSEPVNTNTNTKGVLIDNQRLSVEDIELTESITSIEYLSDTSESEDSKYMINTIKDQLQINLKKISD